MDNPLGLCAAAVGAVVDFLVPERCLICRRAPAPAPSVTGYYRGELLKSTRVRLLPGVEIENHPLCVRCVARLQEARGAAVLPGRWGAKVAVVAPFLVDANLLKIIHLIKFSGFTSLVPLVAGAVAGALPDRDAVLVPVPMRRRARYKRGFNQAALLAHAVARRTGAGVCERLVKRRSTRPQSLTPTEERHSNVADAFAWAGPPLVGRSMVLVDDLVTTGATAAACAGVLLAAGASKVTAACVGRGL